MHSKLFYGVRNDRSMTIVDTGLVGSQISVYNHYYFGCRAWSRSGPPSSPEEGLVQDFVKMESSTSIDPNFAANNFENKSYTTMSDAKNHQESIAHVFIGSKLL